MNIIYASSFRNEQIATGNPVRIVSNAVATYNGVTAEGWLAGVQANVKMTATPVQSFTKRFVCYSVKVTPKGNLAYFAGLSLFGLSVAPYLTLNQPVQITVAQDLTLGTGRAYVNEVFVEGLSAISPSIEWLYTSSVGRTLAITDLVVGESDTAEIFKAALIDQMLTEVSNDWSYNGTSLIDSIDKVVTTAEDPHAETYYDDRQFVVGTEDNTKPLLVEGVGSAAIDPHSYELLVNSDSVELTPSPTLVDLILPPADTITVGRRNIITPPTYPMPNTLALKLDDRDGVYRDLVTKSAMTNVSGTPTTNLTNSKDGQYSTTFTSGFLSKAITPIGTRDYTIEVWAYVPFSTAQQVLVVSSTGPSSSGYVASNLMFVVYVGASGQSFVTYSGSSTGTQAAFTPPLSEGAVGAWHHICIQRSGGIVYGYFNGQRSADSYPQNFNCTGTTLYVGCYSDWAADRRFTGKLSYYGLNVGSTRYPIEGFTPEYPPYRIPE